MAAVKTIREATIDKLTLRLVRRGGAFIGLITADGITKVQIQGDDDLDVWRRLHDQAGKANPKCFGYDGARARFLRFFPHGFRSPDYAEWERDYKVRAKTKLDSTAPLANAATGSGFGEAALSVFQATNLLSPFEWIRVREVLQGRSADTFVRAAARFALGETQSALLEMERVLRPYDCSKWTVVTYLPFLWQPEAHMFLKPEATKDFAARVGHRFASDYEPRLDVRVYQSLLDLAENTAGQLAELRPTDRIDVQSFIWVVGHYREAAAPMCNEAE